MIFHQLLVDIPSSLPQPIDYITLMLHLILYPFLQVLEADGTVGVEIHTNFILCRDTTFGNTRPINITLAIEKMDVTKYLPSRHLLIIDMWPCQQRIMIHQNSLSLHFDFKLVKDSLKNLLELLEVLWLSGVRVMVTTYQNYLAMQQAFDPPHGRKPTTLVAEVAQVEHNGIFWHRIVPVLDQCLVVLCYCRPWTIAEADDVLMAEVSIGCKEHLAAIGKVVFHTIFVFFVKAATVESHDTNLIA